MPNSHETCAIAIYQVQKRAALLFDRIYHVHESASEDSIHDSPPAELTFGTKELDMPFDENQFMGAMFAAHNQGLTGEKFAEIYFVHKFREIITTYRRYNVSVVPLFPTSTLLQQAFPSGDSIVFQATLDFIPTIDEEQLSWDQVLEFRGDREAVQKYRNLRSWLRESVKAETISQAHDIISRKLDDYQWAIKKFDLKTVTGAISSVLDYKQLATTAGAAEVANLVGGSLWSTIAAGLIVTGSIATSIADRMIERKDLLRGQNSEIALIYDLKKYITKSVK